MTSEPDLLILGAGPAGIGAALAATHCGLTTVVVDSAPAGGGQIYRAPPLTFKAQKTSTDAHTGERQRQQLNTCGASTAFESTVWSVGQDFQIDALSLSGPRRWRPRALLVAVGASERVTPFPGWTLPGVIGLAAATILLKSQFVLPGRRTLVAGCGPLLAAVADGILRNGGEVAAVLDLSSRGDWLRTLPALLSARPQDLRRGLNWRRRIRAAGVPWLYRHSISAVTADGDTGLLIEAANMNNGVSQRFEADCVAVGHGLIPSTDITRLLRAEHRFERASGGWIPCLDADQRSSRSGLYVAGDGGGIRGATAAFETGHIAGYAAALDQGKLGTIRFGKLTANHRAALARARRSGAAMARLLAQRPDQVHAITAETIVCRCEDISRAEIDAALNQGARTLNQLKSWTRCGMGPCQGRVCGDTVAELVAAYHVQGGREQAGSFTPRVPLRPLDLDTLTGQFDYDDIPIPEAAPL